MKKVAFENKLYSFSTLEIMSQDLLKKRTFIDSANRKSNETGFSLSNLIG